MTLQKCTFLNYIRVQYNSVILDPGGHENLQQRKYSLSNCLRMALCTEPFCTWCPGWEGTIFALPPVYMGNESRDLNSMIANAHAPTSTYS